MLVAVEGIDGAGKTTLVHGLLERLQAAGRPALRLRRYMVPEITDLYWRMVDAGAIDQHGAAVLAGADYEVGRRRELEPALGAGAVVLADKYVHAHLAFFELRGVDPATLRVLFGAWLQPDVILHVRVPVDVALGRLATRPGKPDLLECALDHRLGVGIGEAFRRYGLGSAPMALRARHFRAHQTAMAARYAELLPPERTHVLDGSEAPAALCAQALEAIEAVRPRVAT